MPSVKVNDINVYYELSGADGNKSKIVLICGLGTNIAPYRNIMRMLSKEYRVLTFDNRGVGRTDKPNIPYTIEMMAEDTAGLLEALEFAPANVIGFSMGGRISMDLTLKHPEMVRSLILTSTSARVKDKRRRGTSWSFYKLVKRIRAIFGGQPYYAFIRQFRASVEYDCTEKLGEIKVPTLILYGKKDNLVPADLVEEMREKIKGSKIITFNGGHPFFFWQVKAFTDAVLEFLAEVKGPSN